MREIVDDNETVDVADTDADDDKDVEPVVDFDLEGVLEVELLSVEVGLKDANTDGDCAFEVPSPLSVSSSDVFSSSEGEEVMDGLLVSEVEEEGGGGTPPGVTN